MLQAAIFDIDGTLIDSVDAHARSWAEAFASMGYPIDAARVRTQIGKGGDMLLPSLLEPEQQARDGAELEKRYGAVFHREYFDALHPFPEVGALFAALHGRGVRLALASSSKKPDLEHYLDLMVVRELVEATTCSEDVENTKPAPDIFQVAVQRLDGADPAHVLAFGDSPWDAQSATRAGLRIIGVRCGGFCDDDLRRSGAMELFDGPSGLLRELDRIVAMA